MKFISRLAASALLGVLLAPTAFAQPAQPYDPTAPLTRAQVRADLAQWRAAGYDPNDWINYPSNAIRAGRIVAEQRAHAAGVGTVPVTNQ